VPAGDVPARLVRFDLGDWLDEVGAPPGWWTEGDYPWRVFKAHRLFSDARGEWRREHGLGW